MRIIHFGVNGWRARFDDGFDAEGVCRVADALASRWAKTDASAQFLVGYDLRLRSREYARTAATVLAAHGLRASLSSSACPISALSWSVAQSRDCAGAVMITGSDNPAEYGGLLVRGADGGTVSEEFASDVERAIPSESPILGREAIKETELTSEYLHALARRFALDAKPFGGTKVVVDPMFGPTQGLLCGLLRQGGCEVLEIHGEHGEGFGGLHPKTTEPWVDECERQVRESSADLGIVLDGDGARAGFIDHEGQLISSASCICLITEHLARAHGMSGRVVATLASSARIHRQAERLGLDYMGVPVGFRRLHDEVLGGGVLVACEEYGGCCIPDWLFERDALLEALYMVELLSSGKVPLRDRVAELESHVGKMYYARRDVRLDAARIQTFRNLLPGLNPQIIAGERPCATSHADGMRLQFPDDSWLMVRPSRTQSLVRAYAESGSSKKQNLLLDAACSFARGEGGSWE